MEVSNQLHIPATLPPM